MKENDPSAGSFNRSSVVRLMESMSVRICPLQDKDKGLLSSRFSKAEKQSRIVYLPVSHIKILHNVQQ